MSDQDEINSLRMQLANSTEIASREAKRADLAESKLTRLNWVTCVRCDDNEDCKYAFDRYNTEGDCLASK